MIFQEIKNGEYNMKGEINDIAKHLISKLLLPKPEDRLGNGKAGSDTDFTNLKKHKFFETVDWEKVG